MAQWLRMLLLPQSSWFSSQHPCWGSQMPVSPAPWDPMLFFFFWFSPGTCPHVHTATQRQTPIHMTENKINLIFRRERDCQSFLLSKCLFPLGGCFWNMPQVWSCLHRTNSEGDQIKTAKKRALKRAANQVKWRQSCETGLGAWGSSEAFTPSWDCEANSFQLSQFGSQGRREAGKGLLGLRKWKPLGSPVHPHADTWLHHKPLVVFQCLG